MYTLITGATSDIGRSIAMTLATHGHTLLISDVSQDALEELLAALPGPGHRMITMDLSHVDTVKTTLQTYITENQLSVCAAVLAAGMFTMKPLRMLQQQEILRDYNISLFSAISILQVLTDKRLNAQALRRVVMVSSVSAKMGSKGYALYGSIKAAILGLVKSLAVELAPATINAVLPGGIRTRATEYIYEAQTSPNPRYLLGDGQPQSVADMIQFLVSDQANWITGQEFVVDGGLTAN